MSSKNQEYVNNAAMNMVRNISLNLFNSFEYILRIGTVGLCGNSIFFQEPQYYFPQQLCPFYIPTISAKVFSNLSISLPELVILHFLNISHPNRYEAESRSFDLHYLNDQ